MRVIAGALGGRKLQAFGLSRERGARPSSDRVKTVLFDLLGPLNVGKAADLFAGTGALGIEALSRGVAHVTFVERDRHALEVLSANLDALGLARRAAVVAGDVYAALDGGAESWPLVLADPPYGEGHPSRLLAFLGERTALAPGGRLAIEHSMREDAGDGSDGLRRVKERRVGDTSLSIYAWGNS